MRRRFLTPLLLLVPALLCVPTGTRTVVAAPQEAPTPLDGDVMTQLDEALGDAIPEDAAGRLYDAAILAHGAPDALLRELGKRSIDDGLEKEVRRRAAWLRARLLHRHGDVRQALEAVQALHRSEVTLDVALRRAELLDAVGNTAKAREAYEEVLALGPEETLTTRLRLRLALLDAESKRGAGGAPSGRPIGNGMILLSNGTVVRTGASGAHMTKPPTEAGEALAAFARADERDPDMRNRAAVLLGLLGHPEPAIDLFQVTGTGRARFRQEIRLAEWALDAADWKRAQELAWTAVGSAEINRDRLYALAVLVEAHRGDDSLDALIEKFAAQQDLDANARNVWIDLLRETGRVEDALRLFRSANEGAFTTEMRRELLEMCRQADRLDVLLASYDEMIRAEPDRIEWREGLARHHLEKGDRAAAVSAWTASLPDPLTPGYRLEAAAAQMALGLDELAIANAEACITDDQAATARYEALLFLCALHKNRGRFEEAEAALVRMDEMAPPEEPGRMQLAEAFEQLGRKDRAVAVLEGVVEARGPDDSGEDVEMRLAWLYSELGKEEEALVRWKALWERIESVPRRRYVEDRLMTVASRLGTLADTVVDLEEKLAAGSATAREAGLLIRIYTKVGDAVSAAEIIDEYMKLAGKGRVAALNEKALVYLACTDYKHYEETLQELMELDPDNATDYLQQLAMSKLERGRLREARKVLTQLKEVERTATSAEFEAGVLALAGLRDDAVVAYRRGIAGHPNHIDSYLLLAKVMGQLGQTDRAIGMFQYLVEHAPKDDLFTIAIDGLLNMEAPQPILKWARRITQERLATRHDKMYLYRLISDLSEELQDTESRLRALENTLPIAGEQRTSVLRELMDLAGSARMNDLRLAYGRRLLSSGELVPPDVYLDLGEAFLNRGDVVNAAKTYSRASDLPDYDAFQRKVADAFEKAGFAKEALRVYQRVLVSNAGDVALLAKVGEMHEQLGADDRAREVYARAIDLMLQRRPSSVVDGKDEKEETSRRRFWFARNVDVFDQQYPRVLKGLLVTLTPGESLEAVLDVHAKAFDVDLQEALDALKADEEIPKKLQAFPRLRDRAAFLRRMLIAFERAPEADARDARLLAAFPEDEKLLASLCRGRIIWGLSRSALTLLEGSAASEERKNELRFLVGGATKATVPGVIPLQEAARLLIPLVREGDQARVRAILERVDLNATDKGSLEVVPSLLWASIGLGDPDLTLTFARKWLRLAADHSQPYEVERHLDLVLGRCRAVLNENQLRSLADALIQVIEKDPKRYAQMIAILPKLQEQFSAPLLDEERAIKLIETLAQRRSWGMGDLLRLIPAERTMAAVRAVFENTDESRRAVVIPQLLGGLEQPMGDELEEYAVGTFEKSLGELQDGFYVDYLLSNSPVRHVDNLPAFVRFAKLLIQKKPAAVNNVVALARYQHAMGDVEAGLETALGTYKEWLQGGKDSDWRWRNAVRELTTTFLPEHRARFEAAIDEVEKGGGSAALTGKRLDLFGRDAPPDELLAALEDAVSKHPDDRALFSRLQQQYRRMGRSVDALELIRGESAKHPEREDLLAQLISAYRGLGHQVAAWEAQERLDALRAKNEEAQEEQSAEKLERPSFQVVKTALADEKPDLARSTFRRIWRMFQMDPRFVSIYTARQLDNYTWPGQLEDESDESNEEEDVKPAKRSRGGLAAFEESLLKKPRTFERVSAYTALAREPFGEEEMRAIVRTLAADQLTQVRTVYVGLAEARVRGSDAPTVAKELLARVDAGSATKADFAVLLALLETHPDAVTDAFRGVLDDLVRSVQPADGNGIRQLARIHAKLGETERARRLYRWCAYLSKAGGVWGMEQLTPLDARLLVDESLEVLEGDALSDVVEAIVAAADPGEAHWGRDQFETLALETFEKALGVEAALAKGERFIANVTNTDKAVKRGTAKVAAALLARAGRFDEALTCLEFGIGKLEPSAEWALKPAWERNRFNWNANLSSVDLRRLFAPRDASGETVAPDPRWIDRVADGLVSWVDGEKLERSNAFSALCLATGRLHEAGQTARARELTDRLVAWSADNPSQRLWALDLLRRVGDEAAARDLERTLLRDDMLYLPRIPEALRHLAEDETPEAAFEAGDRVLRYTTDKEVLDTLIELAENNDAPDRAAAWTEVREESEKAKKAFAEKAKAEKK